MVSTNGSAGGVWQRPQYFDRQQLSAADLNAGLDYMRQRLRWHNRYLHGWGIVCGLRVGRVSAEDLWNLRVGEGYLVTPLGDEVYMPDLTFDIRPGVEACLGPQEGCTDLETTPTTTSVRVVRANIDPPGKDLRTDYNVEWVDICLLREVNLDGFTLQHTINPGMPDEALASYYTFAESGVLPAGTIVRVHSGSRLNHAEPEPDLVHRYVADDTETGNWRLNNLRETFRVLDAAGAEQDTRSFLPGSQVPIDSGAVYLVACPAETPECPQPGVPADCLPPGSNYQFSRVREGYRLDVICERPEAYGFERPTCEGLDRMICEGAPAPCPPEVSNTDNCVILASVQVLEEGLIIVDDLADRRQLVSQSLVQEYLRCRCEAPAPEQPPPSTPPATTPPPTTPTVFTLPTVFTRPTIFSIPTVFTQPTFFTQATIFPTLFTLFTEAPTLFTQFTRFTDLTLFTQQPTSFTQFTQFTQQPTLFTLFTDIGTLGPVIDGPGGGPGSVIDRPGGGGGFPIFTGGGLDFDFDTREFDTEHGREQPVTAIEGIGQVRAERLAALGVRNLLEFAALSTEVAAEVLDVSEVQVAEMQERAREMMRRRT
jgi:hypothetical protein